MKSRWLFVKTLDASCGAENMISSLITHCRIHWEKYNSHLLLLYSAAFHVVGKNILFKCKGTTDLEIEKYHLKHDL